VRHRWNSKTDSREVGGRGFKPWVCTCGAPFIFYGKQIISTGEAVPVGKLVLNGVSQLVLKSPFLTVRRMEIIYAHNQWIKKVLLSNYFLAFYFESHMLEWYGGQSFFIWPPACDYTGWDVYAEAVDILLDGCLMKCLLCLAIIHN